MVVALAVGAGCDTGGADRPDASRADGGPEVAPDGGDADIAPADGGAGPDGADAGAPTGCLTPGDWDYAGDGRCDLGLFWDADCATVADEALDLRCGQTRCHFIDHVCEAMQPCGEAVCVTAGGWTGWFARACPNDPDCWATADLPALACELDSHCDVWCPLHDGLSVDVDCGAFGGSFCEGGADWQQCTGER